MNYTEYCREFCISRAEWEAYRKRRRIRTFVLLGLLAVVLLTAGVIAVVRAVSLPSYVEPRFTAELGAACDPNDCLNESGHTAYFPEGCDTSKRGSFKVPILVDGIKYNISMKVVDTVPPHAETVTVYIAADTKVTPEQFVTNVTDADEVKITFKKRPNTSASGRQEVTVILRDGSGNETILTSELVVIKGKAVFSITIELGDDLPKPYEFTNDTSTVYHTNMADMDFSHAGKYALEIAVAGEIVPVELVIEDTKAPKATVKTLSFYAGTPQPSPTDFIVDYINELDAENITVQYEEKPDMSTPGRNRVRLRLIDASGNISTVDTYVEIIADNEPPVLNVLTKEFEITQGEVAILWRSGVEVSDNSGSYEISLDTSAVDKKTPGRYIAYYVATDRAGNVTKAAVRVIVHSATVTEEMLNEVLSGIVSAQGITDSTSTIDKIKRVYSYVNRNVAYTNDDDHGDWRVSAYNALKLTKTGDCFAFCSSAYALLRYLGFDVLIVERSPENQALAGGTHFWVMVNIGTEQNPQWYHFDATPQKITYRICDPAVPGTQNSYLMTDAQIQAYTRWRNAAEDPKEHVYYYGCDFSQLPVSASTPLIPTNIPEKYYE